MRDLDEFHQLQLQSFEGHLEPYSPPMPQDQTPAEARRATREHILLALERWEEDLDYRFGIVLRESGKMVGQIGITRVVRGVSQSAFVGYWVGRDHVNKGYATEATVLTMRYAFEYLNLHRLTLWIAPENASSLRIPAKLSLRFEGTALKALFLGGKWQDTHIYAITKEEWDVRREELIAGFLA